MSNRNFTPIGYSSSFRGTLDGQNYKISGLNINRITENAVGLFSDISGEVNLTIENSSVIGHTYVGAIAGVSSTNIYNVTISATVRVEGKGPFTGGCVGKNSGRIENSEANGNVIGGTYSTGGFAGDNTVLGNFLTKIEI